MAWEYAQEALFDALRGWREHREFDHLDEAELVLLEAWDAYLKAQEERP